MNQIDMYVEAEEYARKAKPKIFTIDDKLSINVLETGAIRLNIHGGGTWTDLSQVDLRAIANKIETLLIDRSE